MVLWEVIRKKLREAQYFLQKLNSVARQPQSDSEEFGFLLSAFLSATRSITDPLESRRYRAWFAEWKHGRTNRDQDF